MNAHYCQFIHHSILRISVLSILMRHTYCSKLKCDIQVPEAIGPSHGCHGNSVFDCQPLVPCAVVHVMPSIMTQSRMSINGVSLLILDRF